MRKAVFALLLVLLVAGAAAHMRTSCDRKGKASSDPLKPFPWAANGNPEENVTVAVYREPDLCNDAKYPYCRLANDDTSEYDPADLGTYKYICQECRSNCDCKIGEYCFLGDFKNENFGTCQSYKHRLNTVCDPKLTLPPSDIKFAFYAMKRTCGIANLYTSRIHNSTYPAYAWTGPCVWGKCRECNSYLRWQGPSYSAPERNSCRLGGSPFHKIEGRHCDNHKWKIGEVDNSLYY